MKTIDDLGQIDKVFGVPATTRNWNTIIAIVRFFEKPSSPTSIAIHPSGKLAYVTNSGSNNVSMYSVDVATEALTLIGTIGT